MPAAGLHHFVTSLAPVIQSALNEIADQLGFLQVQLPGASRKASMHLRREFDCQCVHQQKVIPKCHWSSAILSPFPPFAPVEDGPLRRTSIDAARKILYYAQVKNQSGQPKSATPRDIVRLAKKTKWRDIALTSGETVDAQTVREMFAYAEAGLKRGKRRKPRHAAAA